MKLLQAINNLNAAERIQILGSLASVPLRKVVQQCISDTLARFSSINPGQDDEEVAREYRAIRAELLFYQEFEKTISTLLANTDKQAR